MNTFFGRAILPTIAASTVFLFTCGFGHPVSPTSGGAPIAIDKCEIAQRSVSDPFRPWHGWRYPDRNRLPQTNGLRIAFVNQTNTPATEVGFRVGYRGSVEYVRDAGTFSPGVAIDHTHSQFIDYAYLGSRPNSCKVVFARFADGSMWRALQ
ncbi:MAG: hypothetical protein ABR975_02315 [Vulcanimicrobiaceae bacterium]|jgi:hypothetical protein